MINYHVHSDFSFDCKQSMEDMCIAAKALGIRVCFTEHVDISDWDGGNNYIPDFARYSAEFERLKSLGYDIKKGVEVCFPARDVRGEYKRYMSGYDFIILSAHYVNGVDPYNRDVFFAGKPLKQAVEEYLLEVRDIVKNYDGFSVVGHIGYVAKYAPAKIDFSEYMNIIDDILKLTLNKGAGIEVNTATFDTLGYTLPHMDILRRYRELGGEILTIGSDAHTVAGLNVGLKQTLAELKDIGFKYVCEYEAMRPKFIKIDTLIHNS